MTIKTKLIAAFGLLYGVILGLGGFGVYYLNKLGNDAKAILKDNYDSIDFMSNMLESFDAEPISKGFKTIEHNLEMQEHNVTEIGEKDFTKGLRAKFEQLKQNPQDTALQKQMRNDIFRITEINQEALIRKNNTMLKTANSAGLVAILMFLAVLLSLPLVVNFPSYIASPIRRLTEGVRQITNKNYKERIYFDRKDEFSELAESFNLMAAKLQDYEHSNLAQIFTEKKRIETLINNLSDPVVGLDENNHILFVNTEGLDILGFKTVDDIHGKYAPDVALRNDLLRLLLKDLDTQVVTDKPLKIFANGKEGFFQKEVIGVSAIPTGEKESVPLGKVIILKNITPFQELNAAKTNFIATISHELKTPISGIKMSLKLLNDARIGALNGEQHDLLNQITQDTDRLLNITKELLDMTQAESGHLNLKLESVEPMKIIQSAMESAGFVAEQRQVRIEAKIPSNLPVIKADAEKTTWVLLNLLTNAIKHAPEGSKVEISVAQKDKSVVFSVKDYGKGIEARYLPNLFDRYFKVPGTINTGGTGLGLAICKEIIEAQGGQIWAESAIGSGSLFSFRVNLNA